MNLAFHAANTRIAVSTQELQRLLIGDIGMHVVVYTSEYVSSEAEPATDIENIVKSAKRNNPAISITGIMFFHQNRFLQFLEGEPEQIEQLMSRIATDKRHKNLQYLF